MRRLFAPTGQRHGHGRVQRICCSWWRAASVSTLRQATKAVAVATLGAHRAQGYAGRLEETVLGAPRRISEGHKGAGGSVGGREDDGQSNALLSALKYVSVSGFHSVVCLKVDGMRVQVLVHVAVHGMCLERRIVAAQSGRSSFSARLGPCSKAYLSPQRLVAGWNPRMRKVVFQEAAGGEWQWASAFDDIGDSETHGFEPHYMEQWFWEWNIDACLAIEMELTMEKERDEEEALKSQTHDLDRVNVHDLVLFDEMAPEDVLKPQKLFQAPPSFFS